jgi:hypothetical protein
LEAEVDGRDADRGGVDRSDAGQEEPDRAADGEGASKAAVPFGSRCH